MGNKPSNFFKNNKNKKNVFKIDIKKSDYVDVICKRGKFILLCDNGITLFGKCNVYKRILYTEIDGWFFNITKNGILLNMLDGNSLELYCKDIVNLVKLFEDNILYTLANNSNEYERINKFCSDLGRENIFIKI